MSKQVETNELLKMYNEKYLHKKVFCSKDNLRDDVTKPGSVVKMLALVSCDNFKVVINKCNHNIFDLFTVTTKKLYTDNIQLCEIEKICLDKKGNIMCIVKPIMYADFLMMLENNTTVKNLAWWFLFKSGEFIPEYNIEHISDCFYHKANIAELYKKFHSTLYCNIKPDDTTEMAKKLLYAYIDNTVSIHSIGFALITRNKSDTCVDKLTDAILTGDDNDIYICKFKYYYPLMYEKFILPIIEKISENRTYILYELRHNIFKQVTDYITRQLSGYEKFVAGGNIKRLGDDVDIFDKIEVCVAYRKYMQLSKSNRKSAKEKIDALLKDHPKLEIIQ